MREQRSIKAVFDKIIQQDQAERIKMVQIAIGEISELDQNIIQQCWYDLCKDTLLEHAQLCFRFIMGEAQCMACFKKYHPLHGKIHCPHCGSFGAKILSGEEFYVEHIETNNE